MGRVQTPTLAMLADRDSKIVLFRKEKYHHVRLALKGAEAVSDRIVSPEDAKTIRDACDGQRAVCVSLVREKKTEKPPKLYDLTTLQREANQVFGYTAKQTLDYPFDDPVGLVLNDEGMQGLCPSLQAELPGGGVVLSTLSFPPLQKVRKLGFKLAKKPPVTAFLCRGSMIFHVGQ